MDEWLFLSLAKIKADAPNVKPRILQDPPLSKLDTATALDYVALVERPAFRGAVAAATAVLINAVFLGSIEQTALDARTPAGEVIVSELDPTALPLYARAAPEAQSQPVAF